MVSMAHKPLFCHQSASTLSVSGGFRSGPTILSLRRGLLRFWLPSLVPSLLARVHGWLSRMSAIRMLTGAASVPLLLLEGVTVGNLSLW